MTQVHDEMNGIRSNGEMCRHDIQISYRNLLNSRNSMVCRHCGQPLRFAKPWHILSRVPYYLFLAAMVGAVLTQGRGNKTAFGTSLIVIFGSLAAYLLLNFLIMKFAPKELDEDLIRLRKEREEEAEKARIAKAHEQQDMSEEQKELEALYRHYEELNREREEQERAERIAQGLPTDENLSGSGAAESAESVNIVSKEAPEVWNCEHELKKSWRNYMPGTTDFVCDKCGASLTFPENVKRTMNIIYTLIMLLMFIPFMNMKVDFLFFTLLVLGVFFVMLVIQLILMRRVKLIPKE